MAGLHTFAVEDSFDIPGLDSKETHFVKSPIYSEHSTPEQVIKEAVDFVSSQDSDTWESFNASTKEASSIQNGLNAVASLVHVYKHYHDYKAAKALALPSDLLASKREAYDEAVAYVKGAHGLMTPSEQQEVAQTVKRLHRQIEALLHYIEFHQANLKGDASVQLSDVDASLARFLVHKQHIDAKSSLTKVATSTMNALGAICSAAAMACPALGFVGAAMFGLSMAISGCSSEPTIGKIIFGFRTPARRRYEQVLRYCAEVEFADREDVKSLVIKISQAKKGGRLREKLQILLNDRVGDHMIRGFLRLPPQADLADYITDKERATLLGLGTEAMRNTAKAYFQAKKQQGTKCVFARMLTGPSLENYGPAVAA